MLPVRQGERDLSKEDLEQVLRQVYGEIPARMQVNEGEIQYRFATWKQHLTFLALMSVLAASILFPLKLSEHSVVVTAFTTICQIIVFGLTLTWYSSIFNKVLVLSRESIGIRSGKKFTANRWSEISEITYSELMFNAFIAKTTEGKRDFGFPRLWTENDYSDTDGSQQFALLIKTLNPASPSVMNGHSWFSRIHGNRLLAVRLIAPAVILVIAALWLFLLAPKQEIFQLLQILIVIPIGLALILIVAGFDKAGRKPLEALPLPTQSYSLLWYLKNPEWDSSNRLYRFKKAAQSFTSASKRKRNLGFSLVELGAVFPWIFAIQFGQVWIGYICLAAWILSVLRNTITTYLDLQFQNKNTTSFQYSLEFSKDGAFLLKDGKRFILTESNFIPKKNLLEVKTVEGTFILDPAIMFDEADTESGSKPIQ